MNSFYEVVRVVNLLIMAGVITTMVIRQIRSHEPAQFRLLRLGLIGILASNMYSTLDVWLRGVPGSPRLVVQTVALVWVMVGTYWPTIDAWMKVHINGYEKETP